LTSRVAEPVAASIRSGSTRGAPAIYFASDYGTGDEFVGVVHAVLHRFAPGVPVIDLGHEVPPFDVQSGAALLLRCRPVLGRGVVLAIVDPGVGSDRRAVALRVGSAPAGGQEGTGPQGFAGPDWLVGPDNGLLIPIAGACGGVREAWEIERGRAAGRGWTAVEDSRTFDGRDLFAPTSAHLLLGGPPDVLGEAVDPASLTEPPPSPGVVSLPGGGLVASVRWIDRFGNVQLDAVAADLDRLVPTGGLVEVDLEVGAEDAAGPPGGGVDTGTLTGRTSAGTRQLARARRVAAFAAVLPDELGLLVDSNGHAALACDRASAAAALGHPPVGSAVLLRPVEP